MTSQLKFAAVVFQTAMLQAAVWMTSASQSLLDFNDEERQQGTIVGVTNVTMDDPNHSQNPHSNFAARRPAGAGYPTTLKKDGVRHTQRLPDGTEREIIACGLACSECFSGKNLHRILTPGFEKQREIMDALAKGEPAAPLVIHTSSGVPEALPEFLKALEVHLPWQNKDELDWCVSLQLEGASAVWAAIDMVLQVNIIENKQQDRLKIAVGATSYHGPPSTSFGAKQPLWHKNNQLIYPVPTAYGTYDEEELLEKYRKFLDEHAHEIGVMLFEPQWGSSQAALPWPKHLLKTYIEMARERGIKIVAGTCTSEKCLTNMTPPTRGHRLCKMCPVL